MEEEEEGEEEKGEEEEGEKAGEEEKVAEECIFEGSAFESAVGNRLLSFKKGQASVLSFPLRSPYFPSYPKFPNKVQTRHFLGRQLLSW